MQPKNSARKIGRTKTKILLFSVAGCNRHATIPTRLRDGRAGLIALAGVQALALAALAKVGGLSWANMS